MVLCLKISTRAGCQSLVVSEEQVGFESQPYCVWQMFALVPLLEGVVLGWKQSSLCWYIRELRLSVSLCLVKLLQPLPVLFCNCT